MITKAKSRRSKFPFFCLLVFCTLSIVACINGAGSDLTPGKQAPHFELSNLDGEAVSLKSFQGSVVVLNFWASWCFPCIEELPALNRLNTALRDQGVKVVSIALDEDPSEIDKIARKLKLEFPILLDPTGTTKRSYEVKGFPETFVLDPASRFVLLADPKSGLPELRIIGPREWDSSVIKSQLLGFLPAR